MSTLGERLVRARKQCGFKTQEALAAATDNVVTRSTIANIESGRYNAQAPVVDLLCRTMKIDKNWLVNGIGEMQKSEQPDVYDELCYKFSRLSERQRLVVMDTIDSMIKYLSSDE